MIFPLLKETVLNSLLYNILCWWHTVDENIFQDQDKTEHEREISKQLISTFCASPSSQANVSRLLLSARAAGAVYGSSSAGTDSTSFDKFS